MIKPNKLKIFKIFGVILCILSLSGCKPRLNPFTKLIVKINYVDDINPSTSIWKVEINQYIGKYNGYHILMISGSDEMFLTWIVSETFDDIKITYSNSNRLRGYKNGDFYYLSELYKNGELSKEDIIKIRDKFYQLKQKDKQQEK